MGSTARRNLLLEKDLNSHMPRHLRRLGRPCGPWRRGSPVAGDFSEGERPAELAFTRLRFLTQYAPQLTLPSLPARLRGAL